MTDTLQSGAESALDLDKLEALARAATPGPWMRLFGERTVYDRMSDGCRGIPIVRADTGYGANDPDNLDYIAAANPAAVLDLIALARRATAPHAAIDEQQIAEILFGLPREPGTPDLGKAAKLIAGRFAVEKQDVLAKTECEWTPSWHPRGIAKAAFQPVEAAGSAEPVGGALVAKSRAPTEEMLNAARDWSVKKFGIGIGNDAAIGCWQAMYDAAPTESAAAPADSEVLRALRDGIPLQEPVSIGKALRAHRLARPVLSGGTGPVACAMLVNIQLSSWKEGPEIAEAYAKGYNDALKQYRHALLEVVTHQPATQAEGK